MTRGGAWAGILVSLAILAGSLVVGVNPGGRHAPNVQCLLMPSPVVGGPYYEDSSVRSDPTFVPLGLSCSWDSPDDSVGPQTIWHPSIVANVVAVIALLAIVAFGAILLLGPRFHLL